MKAKRNVVIVHGWNDTPDNQWMKWLAAELKKRGYRVTMPQMPNQLIPNMDDWLAVLRKAGSTVGSDTVIVTHSLGTPTTLRFLSDLEGVPQIAGLVAIAGFGAGIAEWPAALFGRPIDFERIARMVKRRICIYSDNDLVVRPKWSQELAVNLGAEERIVIGGGHFLGKRTQPGNIDHFPTALEAVLDCYPRGFAGWLARFWKLARR